jgi:DNA-binding LacI/PurR family transcriptional regulator
MNTFYAEIIEGFENILSKSGYSILFGKSGFSSKNEIDCIKLFLRKRVDGIIACSMSVESLVYLKKQKGVPANISGQFFVQQRIRQRVNR